MSPQAEEFTIGVEEEYQIINRQTRQLCARSQIILPTAQSALGDTNAIATLQEKPRHCALAVEHEIFPEEVRQLLYIHSSLALPTPLAFYPFTRCPCVFLICPSLDFKAMNKCYPFVHSFTINRFKSCLT